MRFWRMDARCGACRWWDRIVHPVGETLDYVCPMCKTPVKAYRLIGVIGRGPD